MSLFGAQLGISRLAHRRIASFVIQYFGWQARRGGLGGIVRDGGRFARLPTGKCTQ